MNPGKAVCTEQLNERYGEKVGSWKNLIYKFRTKWKNMRLVDGDDTQLIITADNGYMLNPEIQIYVDALNISEFLKTYEDSGDVNSQIEMLRKFMAMYCGEFMEGEDMNNTFVTEHKCMYNTVFVTKMDKLLELLYSQRQYSTLIGYSMDMLNIYPGSVNVYAWRIATFRKQGQMDIVKSIYEQATSMFDKDEMEMLENKLEKITSVKSSVSKLF